MADSSSKRLDYHTVTSSLEHLGMCACSNALLLVVAVTAVTTAGGAIGSHPDRRRTEAGRLAARAYRPVPLGRTLPAGWIRLQLNAQQAGLCGRGWLSGGVGTQASHANQSTWVGGAVSSPFDESWPYWANGVSDVCSPFCLR